MQKKRFLGLLLLILSGALMYDFGEYRENTVSANQTARAYGNWGALSGSNLQVTVPFNPLNIVVCNDDTSIVIYADITDGVATTSADSTNIRINAGECHSIPLHDQNVTNTMVVGIIAASGTPQYRLEATR